MSDFISELTSLLNRHSKENGSGTPDFILAEYLIGCLAHFNAAVNRREAWYGRERDQAVTLNSCPDSSILNWGAHLATDYAERDQ